MIKYKESAKAKLAYILPLLYLLFLVGCGSVDEARYTEDNLNPNSDYAGIYLGENGSLFTLFDDGTADYYYRDYTTVHSDNKWTCDNSIVYIRYNSYCEITFDTSNSETVFKGNNILEWEDEKYVKLSNTADHLSAEESKAMLMDNWEVYYPQKYQSYIRVNATPAPAPVNETRETKPKISTDNYKVVPVTRAVATPALPAKKYNNPVLTMDKEALPYKYDENYTGSQNLYLYMVKNSVSPDDLEYYSRCSACKCSIEFMYYEESERYSDDVRICEISDGSGKISCEILGKGPTYSYKYLKYFPAGSNGLYVSGNDRFGVHDFEHPMNIYLRDASFDTLKEAMDYIKEYNR